MYSAAVTVVGNPAKHGGGELAQLENVTELLEIQYTSSVYDPKSRTLRLEYQFLNTSTDTIHGPFRLRLVSVSSDMGPPSVLQDSGRAAHAGAVIDISPALPPAGLLPGQTSSTMRMKLSFGPGPLRTDRQSQVAHIEARVFAKRRGGQ
jgi:hypothetical protein